jgi:hypothetical protein
MPREMRLLQHADRLDELCVELSEKDDLWRLGDALQVLENDDDTMVRRLVKKRPVVIAAHPDMNMPPVKLRTAR